MYDKYVYLGEKALREYLGKYGKGLLGKDYEIATAIILKRFFEVEFGGIHIIGFKIKENTGPYLGRINPKNIEEVRDIVEKYRDENDLSDFSIAPLKNFKGDKNSAWIIQTKRFGKFQNNKDTGGLKDFLLKIKKKYTDTPAILAILFDGHEGLELKELSDYVESMSFPFSRILFVNTNQDEKKEWYIEVGEIWPNYGYNRYSAEKIIRKMSDFGDN